MRDVSHAHWVAVCDPLRFWSQALGVNSAHVGDEAI